MSTILDLFIQDFVTTNKLLGQHWSWDALSSRRLLESGPATKVFEFTSGGVTQLAIGRWLDLPDGDCFRFELTHPIVASAEIATMENRFDCLRMMHQKTHGVLAVDINTDAAIIRLTTRHRGYMNLVFVVRAASQITNPILVS
jgi:hypothetical protein